MLRARLVLGSLALAFIATVMVACDGGNDDVDGGIDGSVTTACEGQPDGTACGAGRICMGGSCVAVSDDCGNGSVDDGEQCDDGNMVAFDGCEPNCTFTCEDDVACSDGEACNGNETCDTDTHTCEAGTPLSPGDACPIDSETEGVCGSEATCIAPGCQNGVVDGAELCDDGNDVAGDGCEPDCTFSCTDDTQCDDATYCNGAETCDLTTHTCQAGTTIECTPSDDCHTSTCSDTESRCVEELIDADGDGEAATSLGACGTDCDDSDMDRASLNAEICGNGIDDDCNPSTADAAMTLYYSDCDGDGFAASGATGILACDPPANCGAGCDCTATPPTSSLNTDCNDGIPAIRPGVSEIAGDEVDQNCDGAELCFLDADNDDYRPNATATIMSTDVDCTDTMEALDSDPTGDCADSNPAINPGAAEVTGNEVDDDCNGGEVCFADADMDGYRHMTNTVTSSDTDCTDSGEAAAAIAVDCLDANADARPNQTMYFTSNATGLSPSYDYNCNDTQDRQYTTAGVSTGAGCPSYSTVYGCGDRFICVIGGSCGYTMYNGWTSSSAPACGVSGTYTYCTQVGTSCVRTSVTRTQGCR